MFDNHDIKWIQSLNCLKNCGMSIAEMKEYLALCLEGEKSIPTRKIILQNKREALLQCSRLSHLLTGSRASMIKSCLGK